MSNKHNNQSSDDDASTTSDAFGSSEIHEDNDNNYDLKRVFTESMAKEIQKAGVELLRKDMLLDIHKAGPSKTNVDDVLSSSSETTASGIDKHIQHSLHASEFSLDSDKTAANKKASSQVLRRRPPRNVLFHQLPSRQIESVGVSFPKGRFYDKALTRKNSLFNIKLFKNAAIDSHFMRASVDRVYEILSLDPHADAETKIHELRDMHQRFDIKRQVKARIDADEKERIAKSGFFAQWIYKISLFLNSFSRGLKYITYMFRPWYTAVYTIQGNFGPGVANYFILLRWLMFINLFNSLFVSIFLLLPEVLDRGSIWCNRTGENASEYANSSKYDIITGMGWMSDSLFYYECYEEKETDSFIGEHYSIPLAYLLTYGANLVIGVIFIVYFCNICYRKSSIKILKEMDCIFSSKVFCGWDYSVEVLSGAKIRCKAFCNDMTELLDLKLENGGIKSFLKKAATFILVNIFSIAMIGFFPYLFYHMLWSQVKVYSRTREKLRDEYIVAILGTALLLLAHYIMRWLTIPEYYFSSKIRVYLLCLRIVTLRAGVITLIVYFWLIDYRPVAEEGICVETELGIQIYRLITFDFLVTFFIFTLFLEYARKLLCKYYFPSLRLAKFDVLFNVTDLMYIQTLTWFGALYIPLLPVITFLIMVFLFYIKANSVLSNCRHPKSSWSATETQTFYIAVMFILLLFSVFTAGLVLYRVGSSSCGPFQNHSMTGDVIADIFVIEARKHKDVVGEFLVASPAFYALFCLLSVFAYWFRAIRLCIQEKIQMLERLHALELRDKVYTIRLFDKALEIHRERLREAVSSDSESD